MHFNVLKKYAALEAMSIKDILQEWPKYYDYPPKNRVNKKYLVRELIHRIQEVTFGGYTKQTIDRLEELAENKIISERIYGNSRLAIGTCLIREFKGVEHHATVIENGYEYQGVKYKSLSGIAFAITGTRWNGNVFFGLKKQNYIKPRRDIR